MLRFAFVWPVLLLAALVTPSGAQLSPPTFQTQWGGFGHFEGQFDMPYGVAVSSAGFVYVADASNNRMQMFTRDGTYIREWGTLGVGPGQFHWPYGVGVDAAGNVYVADNGNNRIQVFTSTGTFLRQWGSAGAGNGQFRGPWGLAVDTDGSVYVVDKINYRVQVFTSDGTFLRKFAVLGEPNYIALDGAGHAWVNDAANHIVYEWDTNSSLLIRSWGILGSGNGQFNVPCGIAADRNGNVFVVDAGNSRIQAFAQSGTYETQWGSYGFGFGGFHNPMAIAVDGDGNVYVTDLYNSLVQVFRTQSPVQVGSSSWGQLKALYR
jgi:DNA-binding beta-propeller fold protein YncE